MRVGKLKVSACGSHAEIFNSSKARPSKGLNADEISSSLSLQHFFQHKLPVQATGGKHDTLPAVHPEPNVYFQAVGSYPDVASSAVGAQTAKSPKAGSNNRVRRAQQQELQGQRMEDGVHALPLRVILDKSLSPTCKCSRWVEK